IEMETWSAFRRRVTADFNKQLETYRQRILGAATARGWEPSPIRDQKHYDWLALYQCRGRSPKEIAQAFEVDERHNTIFKMVKQKAALIELTLRPSKQGPRTRRGPQIM